MLNEPTYAYKTDENGDHANEKDTGLIAGLTPHWSAPPPQNRCMRMFLLHYKTQPSFEIEYT